MPKYPHGMPAGDLLEQIANDPKAKEPITATLFGVWEVTVVNVKSALDRVRLWGVFSSEEEAERACQELSDRLGGPRNDAHRFEVSAITPGRTPFWVDCGFSVGWSEIGD